MSSVREFFGPDGPIARAHDSYEERCGQVELAAAIDAALEEGRHLDAEAPAGTGKSFAYLVPLIRHAARGEGQAIVATANIALQEQLVTQDLPFLSTIMPERFDFALLKGLGNYLCLDRLNEAPDTLGLGDNGAGASLRAWAAVTRTGDRSELEEEPPREAWRRVCGIPELCTGHRCHFFDDCFAMAARARARRARIVVTNYHLLFAHLAARRAVGEDLILPPFDTIVCDEAHEMADTARSFFGHRLTPYTLRALLRATRLLGRDDLGKKIVTAADALFDRVEARYADARFRLRLRNPGEVDAGELPHRLEELLARLTDARAKTEEPERLDALEKCGRSVESARTAVHAFQNMEGPPQVYFIERDDDALALRSLLIDPGELLRTELYDQAESVVALSATLRAGGSFDFFDAERGAVESTRLVVSSPFDFQRQCLLVVPDLGCDPNDPRFVERMAPAINRIITELDGRTMALFTSFRSMQYCARAAAETGVTILRQGDRPRTKLLQQFRSRRGRKALFATASFWQGVDIPGDPLSCLVIDRIPFLPPEEPLMQAVGERLPDSFASFSLPRAILELRQGFGRLIRSRSDRGAAVIFDGRLFTKSYGRSILESLPECEVTRDLDRIRDFVPPRRKRR